MYRTSAEDLKKQSKRFYKDYKNSLITSVKFDDFIDYAMKKLYLKKQETKIIKIPKSWDRIIEGDLEPLYEIEVPPLYIKEDIPLWQGSTLKEINFTGLAFEKGDRQKMSRVGLSEKSPHGIIAGSSGSGKTVTVNATLNTAAIEYAPWELKFKLVDAKITEFLNYNKNGILPHIETIGATADAEYIVSILTDAVREMKQRLTAFSEGAGVTNLEEFRNVTGLAVPRVVVVIEEFGALFAQAKNLIKYIVEQILLIAAQGRSAGIHLLMISQQITGDVPQEVLNNMIFRGCLGAYKSVSEKIIANGAASEFLGQKGKLYVNLNTAVDNSEKFNQLFYTPFLPTDPEKGMWGMHDYKRELEKIYKTISDKQLYNFSCFNETIQETEKTFIESLKTFPKDNGSFYLGEPAFVQYWETIKTLPVRLAYNKSQNLMVYSPNKKANLHITKIILYNLQNMKNNKENIGIIYYSLDRVRTAQVLEQFPNLFDAVMKIESYDSQLRAQIFKSQYRMLCEEADQLIADAKIDLEISEVNEMCQKVFFNSYKGNDRHARIRCNAIFTVLKNSSLKTDLGIMSMADDQKIAQVMAEVGNIYNLMPQKDAQFNAKNLKRIYHVIDGIQELVGIGIPPMSNKHKVEMGNLIRKASEYGHIIIGITTNMEEYYTNMAHAFEYYLTYQLGNFARHFKFGDYYPEKHLSTMAVLCSTQESELTKKALKFKLFSEKRE